MKQVVSVKLENEMDLILAHKRAMKLGELTGFSLVQQTSVATAVSEVSRCAIENGKNALLSLGIESQSGKKYLQAEVRDNADLHLKCHEAVAYAKKLVDQVQVSRSEKETLIILRQQLVFAGTLSDSKISSFAEYFDKEPPLSAYDELRRKNQQLQDMAEKIRHSESEYKVLTDTLPLLMFSVNSRGLVSYANKGLQDFFGNPPRELNATLWSNLLHPSDFIMFARDMQVMIQKQTAMTGQYRFKQKSTGNFVWHLISITPLKNDKEVVTGWIGFLVDINAQKQVEQTLKDNKELKETQLTLYKYQDELETKVRELNRSNYELEQFAHLASHDLQEPLRKLFFYSDVLKKRYASTLDQAGVGMLNNMTLAAGRMKELIGDLLSYSQLHQHKFVFEPIDLNIVLSDVLKDLDVSIREKDAIIRVDLLPKISGHPIRLRQLFTNLISNALKYSKPDVRPAVNITSRVTENEVFIAVRDNGIGFEPQFREKIFGLFERLHTRDQVPGTGIGLSICKRIAEIHGGKISATSQPGEYSQFDIQLPLAQQNVLIPVENE